jgi:hypothetical protein
MPSRNLPDRPSLENLRKQAKGLLKAFRAGDPAAVARIEEFHPRRSRLGIDGGLALADAQLVIAREYRLKSWPHLVAHLSLGPQGRRLHELDLLFQDLPDVREKKLTLLEVLDREVTALREGHRAGLPAVFWRTGSRANDAPELTLEGARNSIAAFHRFADWADVLEHANEMVDPLFESACDAIVAGDAAALRSLIDRDPSLVQARSPFRHRATLLHYVAANGVEEIRQWQSPANAVEIAEILLEAGADPDATCPCYGPADTPLILLVTSGHPAGAGVQAALVEALCRAGARPDGPEDDGRPLWEAIKWEYAPPAERLARCGARVDNLLFAAAVGDLTAVRGYFEGSGRLKPDQSWGRARAVGRELDLGHLLEYALIFAAAHGRRAVVELLLTKAPDLTVREPFWKATALEAAAHHQRVEIIALLEPLCGQADAPPTR